MSGRAIGRGRCGRTAGLGFGVRDHGEVDQAEIKSDFVRRLVRFDLGDIAVGWIEAGGDRLIGYEHPVIAGLEREKLLELAGYGIAGGQNTERRGHRFAGRVVGFDHERARPLGVGSGGPAPRHRLPALAGAGEINLGPEWRRAIGDQLADPLVEPFAVDRRLGGEQLNPAFAFKLASAAEGDAHHRPHRRAVERACIKTATEAAALHVGARIVEHAA